MGIGSAVLVDLMDLRRRGALQHFTKVIEVGSQQLSNSLLRDTALLDELRTTFGGHAFNFGEAQKAELIDGVEHLPDDAPPSRPLWEALGFQYSAIEFDGHRDSIPLDLNRDTVSRKMKGAFEILVNTGTTEHVANQDNAFKVMHDLVCKDGIMIHEVPAGGMMNHGLVNYNAKFFFHLARENNYEVLQLRVMASKTPSPIPQNIIETNRKFNNGRDCIDIPGVYDLVVTAILRKNHDVPYVTVLDVPPEIMPTMKPPRSDGALSRMMQKIGLCG